MTPEQKTILAQGRLIETQERMIKALNEQIRLIVQKHGLDLEELGNIFNK